MELTPEEKKRIYEEERTRLEAQERLKGESRGKGFRKGCLGCLGVIGVLFLIGVVGNELTKHSTPDSGSSGGSASSSKLSGENKTYATWAYNYVINTNKADLELAQVMNGLNSAENVLDDVRREIGIAKQVEGMAFLGRPGRVPPAFLEVDAELARINRLHRAAFTEMLTYWKDGSVDHVASGTATFTRAVQALSDVNESLRKATDRAIAE